MSQEQSTSYILWFNEIGKADTEFVGGKNANLGEMYNHLQSKENKIFPSEKIQVPFGFAITTTAYKYFISENNLEQRIREIIEEIDWNDINSIHAKSHNIRELILSAKFPTKLENEIKEAYKALAEKLEVSVENLSVAVRSSSIDEDLVDASFAGQQESYLNISGENNFLSAIKNVFASLFTAKAMSYRKNKNIDNLASAISVGVQKMVRSDVGLSGIILTIDSEGGFDDLILINASYGLGEVITKGEVTPDEYKVLKTMLQKGQPAILDKHLGSKEKKLVNSEIGNLTKQLPVDSEHRKSFALSDEQIITVAKLSVIIENYFGRPMDIEWAYDGLVNDFFIVQARPQTDNSIKKKLDPHNYVLLETGEEIVEGLAVGKKIASGKAHYISSPKDIDKFKAGEILITEHANADWEPVLKIAGGLVTDKGGRASHAAIIAREFGVPAILGTGNATTVINDGEDITISCAQGMKGKVYKGKLKFQIKL